MLHFLGLVTLKLFTLLQENSVADLELKTIRQRYEHLQSVVKEQANTVASDNSKQSQLQGMTYSHRRSFFK